MSASLIVIVALLLVPVVLLCAFAGCASFGTSDPPVEMPTKPPEKPPVVPPVVPPPRPSYTEVVLATPGLASFWRLEEAMGTAAADSGPAKRNGVYSAAGVKRAQLGALDARDKAERSAGFDGKAGFVEVTKPLSPPMSFSIEAWINATVTPSQPHPAHTFVSLREVVAGQARGFELTVIREPAPPAQRGIRLRVGATEVLVVVPGGLGVDTWRHVVMTYNFAAAGIDPKTVKLYINGSILQVNPAVAYTATTSRPLRIGAGHTEVATPLDFFDGRIDEVALYTAALDPATVLSHYQASLP